MKRTRTTRDTLTGGTGDVSPQLFYFPTLIMSAPNTYTDVALAIPVQRLAPNKNKSIVMEVLKVFWNFGSFDSNPGTSGTQAGIQGQLITSPLTILDPSNPAIIDYATRQWKGQTSVGGSYETVWIDPIVHDLTDGAGHGILVATDSIYLGLSTGGFIGASFANVKLLYRWKEVSLPEYIGIVQSQQ